jgi:hypothetical protein
VKHGEVVRDMHPAGDAAALLPRSVIDAIEDVIACLLEGSAEGNARALARARELLHGRRRPVPVGPDRGGEGKRAHRRDGQQSS